MLKAEQKQVQCPLDLFLLYNHRVEILIIYEDKNIIAVNKPAGLLVHPVSMQSKTTAQPPTLTNWLVNHYPEIKDVGDPSASSGQANNRPGIVHRLDKETSGVIIVARNQKTFEYLKNLFQASQIKKTYLGLVWGKVEPKSGTINKPIGLKSGTTKRTVAIKNAKMVKEAITDYQVKKYFDKYSLLEIYPRTGRTHQIRVHLNSINHPIVGDRLYGKNPLPAGLARQFLHAASIELNLPDNGKIKLEASLPTDLELFLKSVELEDSQ